MCELSAAMVWVLVLTHGLAFFLGKFAGATRLAEILRELQGRDRHGR